MLVVAAFECRDQTATILRMETLDNNVVNVTILVELALALLIARGGVLTSLLGTQTSHRPAMADRRPSRRPAARACGSSASWSPAAEQESPQAVAQTAEAAPVAPADA